MAFSGQGFSGCFAHQVSVVAALKGSVIQDELIEAEHFPRDCFALIQIRSKSTIKVLDHRATPVC